ncbi:MAG: hypothetical protein RB292_02010 [Patescibacteria group bacterium]|jgi:hypothetical protein|nr:hypothetical protein [Patescibacteria group bacterium]
MKKFKPVIFTSLICAVLFSLVTILISHLDWPFIPYLIMAGLFMVWVQPEKVSYKFLDKLLAGSLIFGFLMTALIFLRMYLMSRLVYASPLPFNLLWDSDTVVLALVYAFLSFLGGLLGIFFKGLYLLYQTKLDWVIVILGSLLTTLSSLAVFKVKIGGTIMSGYYGLPYSYFTYQIKDVLDGFAIDKLIFSPGSLYHYIVFDYLLYLALFLVVYFGAVQVNKRLTSWKINATYLLFGLSLFLITVFISFLPIKQSFISYRIAMASSCQVDPDCVIIANRLPFSCAIVVNRDNAERILKLVNSFPSTGELQCLGNEKAVCLDRRCQVALDYNSNQVGENNDLWRIFVDEVQKISFSYPKKLTAQYISTVDWPPVVTLSDSVHQLICDETSPESSLPQRVMRRQVDDRIYCVEALSEGAAGSVYTQYSYSTIWDEKLATISFTLQFPQCYNYDEPAQTNCKKERESFDLDGIVDRIIASLKN